MHREHHRWHSPSLGRDMELLVFGHGGARVLVFPTSQGRFYEWEDRARRQNDYERYLLDEVLPFSRHRNPNPFLITTGASFGAYHALDFALRHPDLVGRVLGMAGLYDISQLAGGYSQGEVYFHNPAHYLQHLSDPAHLDALRRLDIVLAIGRDDPMRANNDYISRLLWEKGIGNALRLWDGWAHDWPWWREMVVKYIGGHD